MSGQQKKKAELVKIIVFAVALFVMDVLVGTPSFGALAALSLIVGMLFCCIKRITQGTWIFLVHNGHILFVVVALLFSSFSVYLYDKEYTENQAESLLMSLGQYCTENNAPPDELRNL
ncbi:MAG: hypothetical protein JRF33_23990, partial [Deltaproteobacteria bacterium]|nr:hypothetical protein [Deltaproteobacteria bacterium]